MKLYLDTEFNGHGGELISLALVQQRGEHFYAAVEMTQRVDPWVKENVLPKLDAQVLSRGVFIHILQTFILQFINPEIICDWHADAAHFLSLLQGPDYPSSLDYPCRITILKTPPGQPISANPHNALADAIALRDWHTEMLRNEECP